MKIRILPIILLAGWSISSFGQYYHKDTGVKLGIFTDPLMVWLQSDNTRVATSETMKAGFNVGLTVDCYFSPNYAFATGISWLMTFGTVNYTNGTTLNTVDGKVTTEAGTDVDYKFRHIRIPLGLKLQTTKIGRIRFFADLGFDPLIRVGARVGYDDAAVEIKDIYNVNAPKTASLFGLGVHGGAGLTYRIGGDTDLVVGGSFTKMFTDLTSANDARITANVVAIRIGVLF